MEAAKSENVIIHQDLDGEILREFLQIFSQVMQMKIRKFLMLSLVQQIKEIRHMEFL